MNLPEREQTFVTHFGEMGARWGVNRTVGQIYAVLFLSESPLCADNLVEVLGFSRSNISMGLKELQSWQLVRLQHLPDDRREFFSTPDDLWEIVRTLIEQRKAREIDPTLSVLRQLQMDADGHESDDYVANRIKQSTQMIELLTGWYDEMRHLDSKRLEQLLKLGATAQKVLDMTDRLKAVKKNSSKTGRAN
ncbi:MAG: GbsR/MarR family transcriptional regulator [Burkholderiaceae bacterium]